MAKALKNFVACRSHWMCGEEVPDEVARTLGASGLVEGYPLGEKDSTSEGDSDSTANTDTGGGSTTDQETTTSTEDSTSEGDGLPDLPADLNIPDTIVWIGSGDDQAERAAVALASENDSETPRSSLIKQLEALAEG